MYWDITFAPSSGPEYRVSIVNPKAVRFQAIGLLFVLVTIKSNLHPPYFYPIMYLKSRDFYFCDK